MAKGKGKGSQFERIICFALSRWWTEGKRDDIYRRSATSGGRATVRTKVGKRTAGQYGDIAIADPLGQPLIELATIELKTGYPGQSPFDMIDRVGTQNPKYKQFFEQCMRERKEARTPYWMLIARRKQKDIMIYLPHALYRQFNYLDEAFPSVRFSAKVLSRQRKIFGCPLSEFFALASPMEVKRIVKTIRK